MKTTTGGRYSYDKERVKRYVYDHEMLWLKKLLKGTAPGPWAVQYNPKTEMYDVVHIVADEEAVASCPYKADAEFIAMARNWLPMLAREVEDQREVDQKEIDLKR